MKGTETTKFFADKLSDLISDEKPKTYQDIADETGVPKASISKYINDNGEAGINSLVKIARYFNVSTDYLLGLTPVKTGVDTNEGRLVRSICEYTGLSEDAVEKLHGYTKDIKIDLSWKLEKIKYLDFINFLIVSEEFLLSMVEHKQILTECIKRLEEDVKEFEYHSNQGDYLPIARLGITSQDIEKCELASYRSVKDFEALLSDYTEKDETEIIKLKEILLNYMTETVEEIKADISKEGENNANHNKEE